MIPEKPTLGDWRAEYALSRILANLGMSQSPSGIRYADTPQPEDDPYRYIRW